MSEDGESFQSRLMQSYLDAERNKIRQEYEGQRQQDVQTLAFDLNLLDNEEKKELLRIQKDFVKNQTKSKEREAALQTMQQEEAFNEEKNAYSDNALRRTFAINPARTPTITSRLRDGDVSYIRDTSGKHFKKLKDSTVRLRNLKDNMFANRVDRIFHETREVEQYDRFVTLLKEAKGREQRLTAMRAYIAAQFRKNNYSEVDVDLPILFKVSSSDMRGLHQYRIELFRKGLAWSSSAMVSTVMLIVQSVLALMCLSELGKAVDRDQITSTWGMGIAASVGVFMQIFMHRKGLARLEGPNFLTSVVGAIFSIGIAIYIASHTAFDTTDEDLKFKSASAFRNVRQLTFAVVFCTVPVLTMFIRGFLVGGKIFKGEDDKFKPIQKKYGSIYSMISLGLACLFPFSILANRLSVSKDQCEPVVMDYCFNKMKCVPKQALIREKAYDGQHKLKDCLTDRKNHLPYGAYKNILTGSFAGLNIPHL